MRWGGVRGGSQRGRIYTGEEKREATKEIEMERKGETYTGGDGFVASAELSPRLLRKRTYALRGHIGAFHPVPNRLRCNQLLYSCGYFTM